MRQTLANICLAYRVARAAALFHFRTRGRVELLREKESTSFTTDGDTESSTFATGHEAKSASSATERVPHSTSSATENLLQSTVAREQVGTASLSEREVEVSSPNTIQATESNSLASSSSPRSRDSRRRREPA